MIYLKTSVGIEIRQDDMVISCLRSNFSGSVFTDFTRIHGYATRERQEVRREIDAYFRAQKLNRENVTVGIPRSEAIIRHLDLPREVEDNLKQVVQYQVQSFEPTEEEKSYYDYVRFASAPEDKRIHVLVVMIKKALLEDYIELLRELGLRPARITVGSVALAGLFLQSGVDPDDKTHLLADLRPGGMEILAMKGRALVYSRDVALEAENQWKSAFMKELENVAAKIRLGPEDAIEKIVLTGEASEAARQELQDTLGDCDLMGGHIRVEMPAHTRMHVNEAAVSIGLANAGILRRPTYGLNLLPADLRTRQTRWAYAPSILLGTVTLLLLLGFAFRPIVQGRVLERRLDQEISGLSARVEQAKSVRAEAEALEKKVSYIEGLTRRSDMNLEILQELTTLLPSDSFLNVYRNTDCTIQLSGSGNDGPGLIPRLERSRLLAGVQQRGTIFKDPQTGKDRFNFEAKCER